MTRVLFCLEIFHFLTPPLPMTPPTVPTPPATLTPDLAERIEAVMAKFRPTLNIDGGDIRLNDYSNGVAEVMMLGACIECPISVLTMTIGVKRILLKEVPEITVVNAIFADGSPVPGIKDFMRKTPAHVA